MGIGSKIWSAIRGNVNEVGENIISANSIKILEQEIRDSKQKLNEANSSLAVLVGKLTLSKQKMIDLKSKYDKDNNILIEMISSNKDENLQKELANRIAVTEEAIKSEAENYSSYELTKNNLMNIVTKMNTKIVDIERQLDKIKVVDSVQSAQKSIMEKGAGMSSMLGGAEATLKSIQERQAGLAAKYDAQQAIEDTLNGDDLDKRLADAGVDTGKTTVNAILERARAASAIGFEKNLSIENKSSS